MINDQTIASPWIISGQKTQISSSGRLIIFPFSGGTAEYYSDWKVSDEVATVPLQLPGRSFRKHEPPIENIHTLLEELFPLILSIQDLPFVFYGHSLGALICLNLSKLLTSKGHPTPNALFFSGIHSPKISLNHPKLSELGDLSLIEELKKIGGTPDELINNTELMKCFLPTIRGDIKLGESYRYVDNCPLNCPITVFNGKEDHLIDPPTTVDWVHETRKKCTLDFLNGGHFFHTEQKQYILSKIGQSFANKVGDTFDP